MSEWGSAFAVLGILVFGRAVAGLAWSFGSGFLSGLRGKREAEVGVFVVVSMGDDGRTEAKCSVPAGSRWDDWPVWLREHASMADRVYANGRLVRQAGIEVGDGLGPPAPYGKAPSPGSGVRWPGSDPWPPGTEGSKIADDADRWLRGRGK